MVSGIALNLFLFQEKAVLKLLDMTMDSNEKQTIVMKAPTGSGGAFVQSVLSPGGDSIPYAGVHEDHPGSGSPVQRETGADHQRTDHDTLRRSWCGGAVAYISYEKLK